MDGFVGFVSLDDTLKDILLVRNGSNTPIDADSAPTYRIYGPSGLMTSGTGTLTTFKNTASITGATNASPIAITSTGHGLSTGTRVTISGVLGNTAANGTFNITSTGSNTFTLDGSTGNGAYTSGGTWHVSGLYLFQITPTSGNGYDHGLIYHVLFTFAVSSTVKGEVHSFGVV